MGTSVVRAGVVAAGLGLVLAAALWLSSGAADRDGRDGAASPAGTSTTVPVTAVDGPAGPVPSEDVEVVAEADSGQPPGTLDTVRIHPMQKVDRLTLEFAGAFDGYAVGYVTDLRHRIDSGELTVDGRKVALPAGAAMLRIRVDNATQGKAPVVSTSPGLAAVVGQAVVGSDKDTLTLALGTSARLPFIVMEQADPARLVVEVARPDPSR